MDTEDLVVQTVEAQLKERLGTQLSIRKYEPLSGGCVNQTFCLITNKGKFLLKWQVSDYPDLFIREAEGLVALYDRVDGQLVIPRVIAVGENGRVPGFLVTEFLELGTMSYQDEKLGTGLAYLHRYGNELFGFPHRNFCGATIQDNRERKTWLDFFRENRLMGILGLIDRDRSIGREHRLDYDRFYRKLPDLIPANSRPSLIHGDLWSGNYLYTGEGPALIDPASAWCDREMELSIMALFGGFSELTWNAYKNAFPLVKGWQERIKIYQIYHLLNHYYLFGGFYEEEAHAIVQKYL